MAQSMTWRGLVRLTRLAPSETVIAGVLTAAAMGASLLLPAASAHAVDEVVTGRSPGPTVAALMALLVVRVVAEAYGGLARTSATTRVAASLRYRLLEHVFALGVPGLWRHVTGDLVTRLTGNTARAAGAVPALLNGTISIIGSFGGLVALWLIDWRLGATFLVCMVPSVLLASALTNRVTASYDEYLERLGAIAARLTDALVGSRTIRAAGTGRWEVKRVLAPLPDLARSGKRTWDVQREVSWRFDLLLTGIWVLMLAMAGIGVAGGRISPGEFLAASLYLGFAVGFLEQAGTLISLGDAQANGSRVFEVLAEEPQIRPGLHRRVSSLPAGLGAVSFRGVSVWRGRRIVLDDVALDLPAGAAVALVGRSGTGKTTLALLAGRLVDPEEGEVLIDGIPIDTLDPASLRREVAYAFERPMLLGRTVRDALTYGRAEATDLEVMWAARIAHAEEFIRRLPHGFDTPLAGAPFSGGELQRIGLARAVLHGGRVLVLDDATSSLDTVTEARVTAAITAGLGGRTRLVVAHRAGLAARADLVAWLDGTRIRAVAPHRTLWAAEPDYRAVFGGGAGAP